jgi:hypothetical protein
MVYFPDEVFRNIASFLVDPYKAEKEKHASVWQTIRVKRERFTTVSIDEEDAYTESEDEYFVYITGGGNPGMGFRLELGLKLVTIPTTFYEDDRLGDYDNLHEYINYDQDLPSAHEWHNFEFEQYE